jgi:diguanylate cyclase (GGDEF)-like protein
MVFFDNYQRTAEGVKDQILEENRRLTRMLSESQQSFELLKFVHFNKDINLETLNDIIVGCTGCLYSIIFYGNQIISNLEETNLLFTQVMAHQQDMSSGSELFVSYSMIPDYTVVRYTVTLSQMISDQFNIKYIVLLYPTKFVTPEVLDSVKSFIIVYEVLINIVLTRQKMIGLIETDPLTKLLNRSLWDSNLDRVVNEKEPFFAILLDLDGFKKINDSYGHLKGDEVLKVTGAWLKNAFRFEDKVFRLGGDEFAVIGKANADDIEGLLRKINSLNEGFRSTIKFFLNLDMSISIGAMVRDEVTDADQIYIQIDALLYESKEKGRNTISIDNSMWQLGK